MIPSTIRNDSMSVQVCPTDILQANADRIWDALTIPARLAIWTGANLLGNPPSRLKAGDKLVLGLGLGRKIKIYFDVLEVEEPRTLTLNIRLPLGVVNHEIIQITPIGAGQCRVTFN